jgi:alkylation response protein AidB-like acyl-CoA dehydrogenase
MEYRYNVRDLKFILKEWLPTEEVLACDRFKEYFSIDDVDPIMTEAYKVAREVVSPINAEGDKNPVKFEDGVVTSPPGYKEVFQFLQKNGWGSSSECIELDGGMPLVLYKAAAELISAACPAMGSNIKLTSGAANLIIEFGTKADNERFIPKMISGDWQGTMNLTEPSAGSDVGDTLSRSYPTDDPCIWKIKGTKMFITAGDGSICENTIHMVLARPPQGAKGSAGLGLYIVPKFWVDEDGSMGKSNDVTTIAIEHKMGLNGSATCMLNFGENDDCYGIMVGKAPDEKGRSKGLAMMFNMMNESRIGTGHNANNQASEAYALASQYTIDRVQGYIKGQRVTIIKHADVRRMLLDMKAHTEGIRAMIFKGFYFLDIAGNSSDKAKAKECADIAAILTPLVKCYGSETAVLMTAEAIQCLGGVGYTKEYPVEQYMRDSKVLTIWEGTSFIHGNDLVGRKMTMDNGEPFKKWMGSIKTFIDTNINAAGLEKDMAMLKKAYQSAEEVWQTIASWQANKGEKGELVNLYAIRTLFVFAQLYVAMCLMDQAIVASKTMAGLADDHFDLNFYKGKVASARYYVNNSLPNVFTLTQVIKNADTSVLEVPEEVLIVS